MRRAIQAGWVAIAVGVALASPGPVSVNAAPATLIPNGEAAAAHQVLLSGTAMQGPMVASTVTAYAVDPATGADLQVLGTAKTDASGNFTVKIISRASPLRFAVTGGSFISEADGSTVSQPRRVTVLLPGATSDVSGISINPLTRFVNALTIGRLQTGHTTFAAALSNATATIESYYSLSTDPGRLFPDYTVSGVGTDAGKLGLILGALINEDEHLCPGNPGELVTALALDLVSGVFNGRYEGLPVPYCGGALPAIAGTSDFQDALAGVQQLQYVTSAFALGGLYGPAGILFNQTPPVTPDLLLASLAAINGAITQAAPSTSSTSSPPMTVARAAATATLLPNGRVLIAGGVNGTDDTNYWQARNFTCPRTAASQTSTGVTLTSLRRGHNVRTTMAELPDIIPIFPLPNFVLFPGVTVPLHIFEPRYREMVADVAQTHGTIGMIMLKGDWEREYYAYPDIFTIGCAGRISSLEKLPDGRYNLQLEGISEFQVTREIRSHSYRQAQVQWCPSGRRLLGLEPSEMTSLRDLLVGFLGENADAAWRGLVEEQGLRDADLINFLCFHLDVTPLEKQTLLEALDDRIACLFDVLTFKIEERKLGPSGPRGGPVN